MCEAHGNLYAVQKEILRRMYPVWSWAACVSPCPARSRDEAIVASTGQAIEAAIAKL